MTIDQQINDAFEPISNVVSSIIFYGIPVGGVDVKLILIWLGGAALFFSLYLGFINLRYFKHALQIVCGKDSKEGKSDGEISPFAALTTSLSGTVGLGNIAGVAVAVSLGGPGAVFWMVVMGFLAMSSKFAEVMLAVKYRVHGSAEHPERISGGPMYYLKHAFERYNIPYLGTFFAGFFAVCCIGGSLGGGNMFQANQAFQQAYIAVGGEEGFLAGKGWLFGLGLSLLVGVVIIGGLKSIAAVASRLVPLMGIVYVLAGTLVLALNFTAIPDALSLIVQQAFTPEAGYGGLAGVFLMGLQRAAFSNEAGLGSAAIVHSAAKTDNPVRQGMVGMLGPFIDTIIICTFTALVIVVSGVYENGSGIEGVELTSRALESTVPGMRYLLTFVVFMFAYSTIITWSYYGTKCVTFLFGERDYIELIYKVVYCLCIVIGASANLGNVIGFTDAMIFSMAVPNIVGLFLLAPEIRKDVKAYIEKLKAESAKA